MSNALRDFLTLIDYRELVHRERSDFQDIAVVETDPYGRALFLDGMIQSAASDEALYHAALVHPACLWHGDPQRVLVAGAGEGASLRELLKHPRIGSIIANEIDLRLLELVREHLPSWHAGSFDDPRVELVVADVRELIPTLDEASFDLIVSDLTDPIEDAAQWSAIDDAFVAQLERILSDEGVLAMQFGELHAFTAEATRRRAQLLRRHFTNVHFVTLEIPSFNSQWGFGLAAKHPRPFPPEGLLIEMTRLTGVSLQVPPEGQPFIVDLRSPWAREVGCVDAREPLT